VPGVSIVRSLGVEGPGRAYFFEYGEGPPADGQVQLQTLYTGFSSGTELTFLKNTNPYLHARWDGDTGIFAEGEPSIRYPIPFLGYMEVAQVAQSRAPGIDAGDLLAATYGHKTGHTADPSRELLVSLPPTLDPILGVFVAQMGPIAANAILHVDAEVYGAGSQFFGAGLAGRRVLVIGAGTVGLLTALFAAMAGVSEIVVADPSEFRRGRAEALGFEAMTEEQAWRLAKSRWHSGGSDRGADFVFQTRPRAESLHTALRALRPQGCVIDLAFYQGGANELRLGNEFHHNGLALRCAQIGRVPPGFAHSWDRRRLALETLHLLGSRGDQIREGLITDVVPFEDAPVFLERLTTSRHNFIQIVFKLSR